MNILLDESLGIHLPRNRNAFKESEWNSKPFPHKDRQLLEDLVVDQKEKRFGKQIQVKYYTTQEEVMLVTGQIYAEKPLYYFYDPQTTDARMIRRIQQWLVPDYRLIYFKASLYQAETLFMIDQLLEGLSNNDERIAPVEEYVQETSNQLLILTPKVKPFIKPKKRNRLFPNKNYKTYKLIERKGQKWDIHDVGKWDTLFAKMMKIQSEDQQGWLTYSVLNPFEDEDSPDKVKVVKSSDSMLPGNLPHIQLYLSKLKIVDE